MHQALDGRRDSDASNRSGGGRTPLPTCRYLCVSVRQLDGHLKSHARRVGPAPRGLAGAPLAAASAARRPFDAPAPLAEHDTLRIVAAALYMLS
ncbi:hypothetical protein EVAR_16307_1 [Eumeta japonica]|uniref:Uncharacterized protein n=1 Tax=Eumeta variegata TaxID=151549 RepID=A0A4C1VGD9_EUMVA|nr:hypothetical protein EVAR_16307_1 [Eumeta japonica]